MKRKYPVIDMVRTGQNIKSIMRMKGMTVKDIQKFLELGTPQSIYYWFEGRSLPAVDNLYALSELFCVPVDALLKGNRRYGYRSIENSVFQRVFIYYKNFGQQLSFIHVV